MPRRLERYRPKEGWRQEAHNGLGRREIARERKREREKERARERQRERERTEEIDNEIKEGRNN